jgi:hypothetical protein
MDKFNVANIAGVSEEEVVGMIGEYNQNKKSIKSTIENIMKVNKERKENKIKLYRSSLRDCIGRIEQQNYLRKTGILYKFDEIIFGHPEYDREECIEYVINELQKYGFNTQRNNQTTVLISWKFIDTHTKS